MLQSYKDKTALVVDEGLFIELARKLAKDFKRVMYYSPWKCDFPKSTNYRVGSGMEDIEKIDDMFDHIDETDIFVFPDIYRGDLQLYLESQGHRVFGGRKGEELELFRDDAKKLFKKLGLDVGKYEVITGLADLRTYLKENDKQYVKINSIRGDTETFYSPSYDQIEPKLDELEHVLGPTKFDMKFIVEEAIENAVETGFDGYCIDGKYPDATIIGVEVKDCGYVGTFKKYSELPKEVTDFNDKIAPTMRDYHYRGFFSTEQRVTKDHKSFMIDACARCGSPPSELYQEMYENIPDIVWFGAEGKLVNPICKKKYGVEIVMNSVWGDKNWQPISFPEKYRDNVKLRKFCIIKDEYYVVPQHRGGPDGKAEIGALVATGDTREEAIKKVKEVAEQVQGYDIEICEDALDKAQEEIDKLAKMGIKI